MCGIVSAVGRMGARCTSTCLAAMDAGDCGRAAAWRCLAAHAAGSHGKRYIGGIDGGVSGARYGWVAQHRMHRARRESHFIHRGVRQDGCRCRFPPSLGRRHRDRCEFHGRPGFGFVVALAIMAHEIPREAGNAGVLVAGGYAPTRAFGLSIATTVAIPLGAVGIVAIGHAPVFIGTSLAIAAGSTIYLAIGDVLPGLWLSLGARNRFTPVLGVVAGLLFMWAAALFDHGL